MHDVFAAVKYTAFQIVDLVVFLWILYRFMVHEFKR
jgi:hypothetical protein